MSADVAACYFCLGEEVDEVGKPLVRDCSCRGDSAGFAHLSCLEKYGMAADGVDMSAFTEPWEKCTNCKQPFQNQLAIDLSSSCVTFAEATYGHEGSSKWDKLKVLAALRLKITAIDRHETNEDNVELTMIINKLLSMVDEMKKELKISGWIHMPKASEKYVYYAITRRLDTFIWE